MFRARLGRLGTGGVFCVSLRLRKRQDMARRRRYRKAKRNLSVVLLLIAVVAFIQCSMKGQDAADDNNSHKKQGDEVTDVRSNPAQKCVEVDYKGFTVGFNPEMHIPNWVAWELTKEETYGTAPRYNFFSGDPDVKGSAEKWDYNYSGYDRGHMAPAGDMKWDEEVMRNTFYMTNICPQAKSLNTGTWKKLEEKCREWARSTGSLIIICGPVLTDDITEFIGDNKVAVPERFFKVILSPGSKPMRGIGFVMPNGSVPGGLQNAAMSIDEVEAITGHDFFSALPDSIESAVESQKDFHYWSTLK